MERDQLFELLQLPPMVYNNKNRSQELKAGIRSRYSNTGHSLNWQINCSARHPPSFVILKIVLWISWHGFGLGFMQFLGFVSFTNFWKILIAIPGYYLFFPSNIPMWYMLVVLLFFPKVLETSFFFASLCFFGIFSLCCWDEANLLFHCYVH